MYELVKKHTPLLVVSFFILVYAIYFSSFSILRYKKLYSHYFDLGIMHQTAYNSYKAVKTGDLSRMLEMTDPHSETRQIKRMAIHNDPFLALAGMLYFIYEGPESLLLLQTVVVAFGSLIVYGITIELLRDVNRRQWIGVFLASMYLLYPPLQRAVAFDFHAVTLASTFVLVWYYLFLKKRYIASSFFFLLALSTKENVGLSTGFFAGLLCVQSVFNSRAHYSIRRIKQSIRYFVQYKQNRYILLWGMMSIIWVVVSMKIIIPTAQGGMHFGADYYTHVFDRPWNVPKFLMRRSAREFVYQLLVGSSFLPLFSPFYAFSLIPDALVKMLSTNDNLTNTYFHYGALISSFIFISAAHGMKKIFHIWNSAPSWVSQTFASRLFCKPLLFILIGIIAVFSSVYYSGLPYARRAELHPFKEYPKKYDDVLRWREELKSDDLIVATTGEMAPYFTSRRVYLDFDSDYFLAEYVVIDTWDAENGFLKDRSNPAYELIQTDPIFEKVFENDGIEVYKKIKTDK